jgi:DNA modification methylase
MNVTSVPSHLIDRVLLGDVMGLLKQLPDKSIDMVYADPDYNVGVKYGETSYTRGFEEYIGWYIELAKQAVRIIKDDGNLFFINYPKQNAYLRVKYLDAVCYEVSDYSWVYNSNVGHSPKRLTTAHRSILHARKTSDNRFYKDQIAVPYQNPTDKRIRQNIANGSKGRMPYDWFYFDLVKNVSKEKTFHACQIPQKLAEMLILSCTKPGDVVAILFGGSGAEVAVCKQLDRRFVSAEIDPKYHSMIMDRLMHNTIEEKYRIPKQVNSQKSNHRQPALLENKEQYVGQGRK